MGGYIGYIWPLVGHGEHFLYRLIWIEIFHATLFENYIVHILNILIIHSHILLDF